MNRAAVLYALAAAALFGLSTPAAKALLGTIHPAVLGDPLTIHTHVHRHEELEHEHPHVPDMHHQHRH